MKLRCYIIDDEPPAIRVLESHAEKIDHMEIAGTFTNPVEAIQKLREEPVDLLFLDIKMPKLTGIDFINVLQNPPKVIFTTAYREFALEGFELDVVDYLLKPISFQRFLKAVNKIGKTVEHKTKSTTNPLSSERPEPDHVYVHVNNNYVKVNLFEITYIESDKNKIKIFTGSGKHLLVRQTLTSIEEKLPGDFFIRIHRSFIVAIPKIQSFTHKKVIVDEKEIPIGRSYKKDVIKTLQKVLHLM